MKYQDGFNEKAVSTRRNGVDAQRQHEQLLAAETVGQLAEEQRPDVLNLQPGHEMPVTIGGKPKPGELIERAARLVQRSVVAAATNASNSRGSVPTSGCQRTPMQNGRSGSSSASTVPSEAHAVATYPGWSARP